MTEHPSVVVLGRRGLTRDVVAHLLERATLDTVDLDAVAGGRGQLIAVLVEPGPEDWDQAEALGAAVVVVAESAVDDERLLDYVAHGALAVLDVETGLREILDAIETVGEGAAVLRPHQTRVVLEQLRSELRPATDGPSLTRRESEILESIARGESVKQTARALQISEKTVQNLQSRLFRKIGARNRAQAVTRAHELGLVGLVGQSGVSEEKEKNRS